MMLTAATHYKSFSSDLPFFVLLVNYCLYALSTVGSHVPSHQNVLFAISKSKNQKSRHVPSRISQTTTHSHCMASERTTSNGSSLRSSSHCQQTKTASTLARIHLFQNKQKRKRFEAARISGVPFRVHLTSTHPRRASSLPVQRQMSARHPLAAASPWQHQQYRASERHYMLFL